MNQRTVENWFQGNNGHRGDNFVRLDIHSNDIRDAFLMLAGRRDVVAIAKTADILERLRVLMITLGSLMPAMLGLTRTGQV